VSVLAIVLARLGPQSLPMDATKAKDGPHLRFPPPNFVLNPSNAVQSRSLNALIYCK